MSNVKVSSELEEKNKSYTFSRFDIWQIDHPFNPALGHKTKTIYIMKPKPYENLKHWKSVVNELWVTVERAASLTQC